MERQTVTITVKDREDGSVSIVCVPSFGTLQQMRERVGGLTSAQTYAIAMMNRAREMNAKAVKHERKVITLDHDAEPGRIIKP